MKRIIMTLSALAMALVLAACAMGPQTDFSADLTSDAEVPAPTLNGATPEGSATATLSADGSALVVDGTFTGLTGPAQAAHIHGPAEPGETAGVLFPLTIDNAASGDISGTWNDITDDEVEQLRDGLFYVNVHTDQNPAGEIRGQLD
jgi:hypothetical protein